MTNSEFEHDLEYCLDELKENDQSEAIDNIDFLFTKKAEKALDLLEEKLKARRDELRKWLDDQDLTSLNDDEERLYFCESDTLDEVDEAIDWLCSNNYYAAREVINTAEFCIDIENYLDDVDQDDFEAVKAAYTKYVTRFLKKSPWEQLRYVIYTAYELVDDDYHSVMELDFDKDRTLEFIDELSGIITFVE